MVFTLGGIPRCGGRAALVLWLLGALAGVAHAEVVAHWRFDEGVDGSRRNLAADVSGQGNHLVADNPKRGIAYSKQNVTVQGAAIGGKSVQFDGEQDLHTQASAPINTIRLGPGGTNAWTMEVVFRLDSNSKDKFQVLLAKEGYPLGSAANLSTFCIKYYRDYPRIPALSYRLVLELLDGSGREIRLATSQPIETNKWYAAAFTANATEAQVWLKKEGETEYTLAGALPIQGAMYDATTLNKSWLLGRGQWQEKPTDYLNGELKEVRIANSVLEPAEFLGSSGAQQLSSAGTNLMTGLIHDGGFRKELTAWAVTTVDGSTVNWVNTEQGPRVMVNVVRAPGISPWQIALRQWIHQELPAGQSLVLIVRMRSPTGSKVNVCLENALRPAEKVINAQALTLEPEFKDYTFTGTVTSRLGPGQVQLSIHMGLDDGQIEIASIQMMALGS